MQGPLRCLALAVLLTAPTISAAPNALQSSLRSLRQRVQRWSSGEVDPHTESAAALMREALGRYEELQAESEYSRLPEQTRVAVIDSEFSRTAAPAVSAVRCCAAAPAAEG